MENHHVWWVNQLFLWPFFNSKLLVYQRVAREAVSVWSETLFPHRSFAADVVPFWDALKIKLPRSWWHIPLTSEVASRAASSAALCWFTCSSSTSRPCPARFSSRLLADLHDSSCSFDMPNSHELFLPGSAILRMTASSICTRAISHHLGIKGVRKWTMIVHFCCGLCRGPWPSASKAATSGISYGSR